MRALAEFILRGRLQAAVVALIGNWIPLLTPAAVALVTLRAGANNGLLILLWGLLPALLLLGISQIAPAMALMVMGGTALTFMAALLLRRGSGWPTCLMALVALASLFSLLLAVALPESVQAVQGWFEQAWSEMRGPEGDVPAIGITFAVGVVACSMAFPSALGLILGRWWQSLVVNPGGFGAEFRALKLHPAQAAVCMAAAMYCLFQNLDYTLWFWLFALPLLFQGVAVVHGLAAIRGWGTQWLVLFYGALFLLGLVAHLLVLFAFLDTWLNFRERAKPRA
ncbi:hypothetical protein [Marinimicrobium agarilyticum]|uniref:hypothetical protein n=1 Tax=Marinimicrobium agarilyticum TaxID=306546 RepID=UPI0004149B56|nr:hypothetical protein [Marinimicrobium agarilyticum]